MPPKTTDPSTWRLKLDGEIPYKLVKRSGSFGVGQVSAVEEYIIQAERLWEFIRKFFPLPETTTGIPIIKNRAMGGLGIRASSISWDNLVEGVPTDPFSTESEPPAGTYHPLIKVVVNYSDEADQPSGNGSRGDVNPDDPTTFLNIEARSAGEFIYLPSPAGKWIVDEATGEEEQNKDPNNPISLIVPMIEWSFTWPLVSRDFFNDYLLNRLRDAQGKVNDSLYEPLNAPAETLLFTGWSISDERQFIFDNELVEPEAGILSWLETPVRLTVTMLEKRVRSEEEGEIEVQQRVNDDQGINELENWEVRVDTASYAGHNHFWRGESGWTKLKYDGQNEAYQLHDFDKIFALPNGNEALWTERTFERREGADEWIQVNEVFPP